MISPIAHAAAAGVNGATTAVIDTTGADLLVVGAIAATAVVPTDSLGNTWSLLTSQAGTPTCRMAYCLHPASVGPGHTFSAGGLASLAVVLVAAFKGVHFEKVDAQVAMDGQSGSHNLAYIGSAQPGDVLPSMSHMLLVTAFGWASVDTMSQVDPSMTLLDQINVSALVNYGGGMAYMLQDVQANVAAQWNFALTMSGSVACAAFRAAYGGSDMPGPFHLSR